MSIAFPISRPTTKAIARSIAHSSSGYLAGENARTITFPANTRQVTFPVLTDDIYVKWITPTDTAAVTPLNGLIVVAGFDDSLGCPANATGMSVMRVTTDVNLSDVTYSETALEYGTAINTAYEGLNTGSKFVEVDLRETLTFPYALVTRTKVDTPVAAGTIAALYDSDLSDSLLLGHLTGHVLRMYVEDAVQGAAFSSEDNDDLTADTWHIGCMNIIGVADADLYVDTTKTHDNWVPSNSREFTLTYDKLAGMDNPSVTTWPMEAESTFNWALCVNREVLTADLTALAAGELPTKVFGSDLIGMVWGYNNILDGHEGTYTGKNTLATAPTGLEFPDHLDITNIQNLTVTEVASTFTVDGGHGPTMFYSPVAAQVSGDGGTTWDAIAADSYAVIWSGINNSNGRIKLDAAGSETIKAVPLLVYE